MLNIGIVIYESFQLSKANALMKNEIKLIGLLSRIKFSNNQTGSGLAQDGWAQAWLRTGSGRAQHGLRVHLCIKFMYQTSKIQRTVY